MFINDKFSVIVSLVNGLETTMSLEHDTLQCATELYNKIVASDRQYTNHQYTNIELIQYVPFNEYGDTNVVIIKSVKMELAIADLSAM